LLQLSHLASLFPQLFEDFSDVLPQYAGMHWDDFAAITSPVFFEASFDSSYLLLRLHFLDGELHIVAQLSGGILTRRAMATRVHCFELEPPQGAGDYDSGV
jgi:hypothetical protein